MPSTVAVTPTVTLDEAVRAVTAFDSFADLKATQPSYAPTFYTRNAPTPERALMVRVTVAFNAWAARVGRAARAEVKS